MIIGITGTMGSGKGEIANYLIKKGFEYYCFSDILKEEARKRNIKPTRKNLQKLGNDIKKDKANRGILAKRILGRIKTDKAVLDGIRNVDEVRELRKTKEFFLIGINVEQKLRFLRMKKRARPGDPAGFNDFKKLDDKENKGVTKGQEINKCLEMADFTVINDGSLGKLKEKTEGILKNIRS